MWIVNDFREIASSNWQPKASDTYHGLVTAPLSLVIPLLVISVILTTFPLNEVRVRRGFGLVAASCCVCLTDLILLIIYISQLAMIEAEIEREFWRNFSLHVLR